MQRCPQLKNLSLEEKRRRGEEERRGEKGASMLAQIQNDPVTIITIGDSKQQNSIKQKQEKTNKQTNKRKKKEEKKKGYRPMWGSNPRP